MEERYRKRLEKVYGRMGELGLSCMLITPSPNMKYLTGYAHWADERLLAAVIAPGRAPFVVANRLYAPSLAGMPYEEIVYWRDGEDPYALLAEQLRARDISLEAVAVDDALAAGILVPVLDALPVGRVTLACRVLDGLRMYKDPFEQRAMRTACTKASRALRTVMEDGRRWIGHTERELANALCNEMVRQGLAYGSASVSSQANSAQPHHLHDDTVIQDHTCMWIDFGSTYENYNTDMTRAFYFGQPDPEYLEVHRVVNEARAAGIAAARAGEPLGGVDAAARGVIRSYGYGEYFTHRTGHGIGIMNHEGPSAAEGETTPIAPGMAFTVEPGIYLPGKFGVRIEDQILIGEDGRPEALHNYLTELAVFR